MRNKINIPGHLVKAGEMQNDNAKISITEIDSQIKVEAEGLVVSICGGGSFLENHPVNQQVKELSKKVVAEGGIIVNGGENRGTMLAAAQEVPEYVLGVHCDYHDVIKDISTVVVDNYQSRKMILTSLPVIVVFPGQIGTFDELVKAIGWANSLAKQNKGSINLYVHEFWQEVIDLLLKKAVIQDNVKDLIHIFKNVNEIF